MKMKFHGRRRQLAAKLATHGVRGRWQKEPNGVRMMRCDDGANLHWAKGSGSIWLDGKREPREHLARQVAAALQLRESIAFEKPGDDAEDLNF